MLFEPKFAYWLRTDRVHRKNDLFEIMGWTWHTLSMRHHFDIFHLTETHNFIRMVRGFYFNSFHQQNLQKEVKPSVCISCFLVNAQKLEMQAILIRFVYVVRVRRLSTNKLSIWNIHILIKILLVKFSVRLF